MVGDDHCAHAFVFIDDDGDALPKGKNVFAVSLDAILSGRIRLGAYAYEHYGLSLFGKNLTDVKIQYDAVYGLNAFTFDNIYTDILMRQGAIWLLVIAVLFYRLARKEMIVLILRLLHGDLWNYRGSRFKCVYVICDIAC